MEVRFGSDPVDCLQSALGIGQQLHVLQMYDISYGMAFLDTLGQAHKV